MAKTWLITGASRGFGLEIAKTVLANGDRVVASGRNLDGLEKSFSNILGQNKQNLLLVRLDVTDNDSILQAVNATVQKFGTIDILVNNAGYGQLSYFEMTSPQAIEQQFATNVFGVMNVTQAVLPYMRKQKSGHVINISSLVGIIGIAGSSIYCATKGAITSWSESLSLELEEFGISVTCVHPGSFRTDFVDEKSVKRGDILIDAYAKVDEQREEWLKKQNHTQPGDPQKFAQFILKVSHMQKPPIRIAAGTDSFECFATRAEQLLSSAKEFETLSKGTDF